MFKEKDDNDKACSEDGDAKSIKPELMFTSGELDNGGYVNQMYYTTTFVRYFVRFDTFCVKSVPLVRYWLFFQVCLKMRLI